MRPPCCPPRVAGPGLCQSGGGGGVTCVAAGGAPASLGSDARSSTAPTFTSRHGREESEPGLTSNDPCWPLHARHRGRTGRWARVPSSPGPRPPPASSTWSKGGLPRTRRLRPGSRTVNNAELSRRWVSASWHEPVSQTRGRSWHEGGLPRAAPESSSREVAGGHRAGTGRGPLTRGRGWPPTALGAGTALWRCPEAGRGARFGAHASARHGPPPTCKHSLSEDAPCAKGVPAEGEWPRANVGGMDKAPTTAPRTPLERARGPATARTDAGPTAARPVPSGSGSVTLAPRAAGAPVLLPAEAS